MIDELMDELQTFLDDGGEPEYPDPSICFEMRDGIMYMTLTCNDLTYVRSYGAEVYP